eukprot:jgi/Bigna1/88773/estExt_fgenesh1_pg.C_380016
MASSSRQVWDAFIKDPSSVSTRVAVETVWKHGVSPAKRMQVWTACLREEFGGNEEGELFEAGANALSVADTDDTLPEDLIFQLESLHISSSFEHLSREQIHRVGMLVQCHTEMEDSENTESDYTPGVVQIMARIVDALGDNPRNDHKLLGVFSKLGKCMRAYSSSTAGKGGVKNQLALLLSMMRENSRRLCNHFDQLGIDIMDLVTIVELWVTTLFSEHFPEDLSLQAMDIVMVDGTTNLIWIVYGILKTYESKLISITESKRLFDALTEIPTDVMRNGNVKGIMSASVQAMEKFKQQRSEIKESQQSQCSTWEDEVGRKGKLDFIPSSDETVTTNNTGTSTSKSDSKNQHDAALGLVNEGSGDEGTSEDRMKIVDTLELLAKTSDPICKRALEQALDELRAYDSNRFRADTTFSTGSSKHHHHQQQQQQHRESKGNSSNPESRGSTLDSVQREAIAKGFVPYSQLYQYQDFPCLYMEGYLQKPRSNSTLHKRFFVLHGSYLTHFRSHKHRRSSRDVAACVRGATIKAVEDSQLAKHGLEITLSSGTTLHTLFAEDSQIQKVWIRVLHAASKSDE